MPGIFAELYDTPWQEQPRTAWFCSDACEEAYTSSGSFDYDWCDGCNRQICGQNPGNGWHVQFREHEELGYVCLRCYETEILENGQPRSDFEGSRIKGGMFFSHGNEEPKRTGFEEVSGFDDYFVATTQEAKKYNSHALSLIDHGRKVLTAYERMAIGGLEGYVTMMAKAPEQK
ncbi:MAG: hypothetical protein HY645_13385 [Acidobacteria bacterium]|nr:hypothetical protein [Acidobacteriota bacterium]